MAQCNVVCMCGCKEAEKSKAAWSSIARGFKKSRCTMMQIYILFSMMLKNCVPNRHGNNATGSCEPRDVRAHRHCAESTEPSIALVPAQRRRTLLVQETNAAWTTCFQVTLLLCTVANSKEMQTKCRRLRSKIQTSGFPTVELVFSTCVDGYKRTADVNPN